MFQIRCHCPAYVLRCSLPGSQALLFQLNRTHQALISFLSPVTKSGIKADFFTYTCKYLHTLIQRDSMRNPFPDLRTAKVWKEQGQRPIFIFKFCNLLSLQPPGSTGVVGWQLHGDDNDSHAGFYTPRENPLW